MLGKIIVVNGALMPGGSVEMLGMIVGCHSGIEIGRGSLDTAHAFGVDRSRRSHT